MDPKYWPVLSWDGSTLTVAIGGAGSSEFEAPEFGVTANQFEPPDNVLLWIFQFIVPRPVLRTAKVCGGTGPPFAAAVNCKPVCDRRMECG